MRQIALLRGINLGARRRVAMPELRELLAGLGYEDVRTLLQSGNVVLGARQRRDRLARALEREIEEGLGVAAAVVVRSRDELAAVVARNPVADVMTDGRRLQVSFLAGDPDPAYVEQLAAADLGDERVAVIGRELYAWHPHGIQRSPLAKLISDKGLGTTATARNWNTVGKLLALADTPA
jgi:uncharacterized protein (DUF1697 family)